MCIHTENMQITDACSLPIVSVYGKKIELVERIDALLDCEMGVSPGRIVLVIILDALSGRSPLFPLNEFYADEDSELVSGSHHEEPSKSCLSHGKVMIKSRHSRSGPTLNPIGNTPWSSRA